MGPARVAAQAARFVVPDTIVIIRDSRDTSKVGYLFPRVVAIEYLNLRTKILPSKNELIESLQKSVSDRDAAIVARDTIIKNRDEQTVFMRGALAKSDSIGIERERQLKGALRQNARLKRIMKVTLPASVVGGLLIGWKIL